MKPVTELFCEDMSETQGGYVENKVTGDRIPINKEGGTYGVTIWRLREAGSGNGSNNGFAALSEDDGEDDVPETQFGANSSSSTTFRRHA